jgi:hypothetical protein
MFGWLVLVSVSVLVSLRSVFARNLSRGLGEILQKIIVAWDEGWPPPQAVKTKNANFGDWLGNSRVTDHSIALDAGVVPV